MRRKKKVMTEGGKQLQRRPVPGEEGRTDLVVINSSELTQAHFEKFPCWSELDGEYYICDEAEPYDEDGITPVTQTDPIPAEVSPDYMKANFVTPAGLNFAGYICGGRHPHAIALFFGDDEFLFNWFFKDWTQKTLTELREALGQDAEIFPLTFNTGLRYADEEEEIAGTFDPLSKCF